MKTESHKKNLFDSMNIKKQSNSLFSPKADIFSYQNK